MEDLIWSDYPKAISLATLGVQETQGKGSWCEGKARYALGKVLWVNGNYQESLRELEQGVRATLDAKDIETAARSFLVMANDYYFQGYYDSAGFFFNKAKDYFIQCKIKTGQIEVLHDMALMYHRKGDFSESMKYLLELEKLKEEEPDFVHYVGDFKGLSSHFIDTLYYREEIRDEKNLLTQFRKSGNQVGVYQSMINLGVAFKELGDHRTAAGYYAEGSKLMKKLGFYPFWYLAGNEFQLAGMKDSSFYYHYKAKAEFPRATQLKIAHS